jgi:cold-inducible RNA-binding protein
MPNSTTEEDITEAMAKFGEVKKCRIPTNRDSGNPLGFAIVVFAKIEEASRALAEEEINVDMACLLVEKAMQSRRPDNRFENARDAFSMLKGGSGGGGFSGGDRDRGSRGGYGGGGRRFD